jgi:lipoprotein-anchoring transpeptidase ErfK/SrfK
MDRALYLYDNIRDALSRIHGKPVSSECIHMFNQDVVDLYNRVPVDANGIVLMVRQWHISEVGLMSP